MPSNSAPAFPDFEVTVGDAKARATLEWRGARPTSITPFWSFAVAERGPFRPGAELDLKQARALAAAVAEYDRKAVAASGQADATVPELMVSHTVGELLEDLLLKRTPLPVWLCFVSGHRVNVTPENQEAVATGLRIAMEITEP